jgi:hypothetical protein
MCARRRPRGRRRRFRACGRRGRVKQDRASGFGARRSRGRAEGRCRAAPGGRPSSAESGLAELGVRAVADHLVEIRAAVGLACVAYESPGLEKTSIRMKCFVSWCWRGSSNRPARPTHFGSSRKLGAVPVSYPMLNRWLPVFAKLIVRLALSTACAAHAQLGPASLVLYDVKRSTSRPTLVTISASPGLLPDRGPNRLAHREILTDRTALRHVTNQPANQPWSPLNLRQTSPKSPPNPRPTCPLA